MKLYLDPGHGGQDPGAQGNGLNEKDITLDIALKLRKILLNDYENVDVKMSRTSDTTVSLSQRTTEANKWGADFYLAIHINSDSKTAQGYEDYIYRDLASTSTTAKYQNIIHTEVLKMNKLQDRGEKKANFHVLRESAMPALLTENGFIDNAHDAALMKQGSWRQDVAQGHANGLAKAFKLKKKAPATKPKEPTKAADSNAATVYKVMVGSFKAKENAQERVAALSKIGMKSSIVTAKISGATWYRVQAGSFTSRPKAEALLNKLEKVGYNDSFIVIEKESTSDNKSGKSASGTSANSGKSIANSEGSSTNSGGSSTNSGENSNNAGGSNTNSGENSTNSSGNSTNSGGSNTNSGENSNNAGGSSTNSSENSINSGEKTGEDGGNTSATESSSENSSSNSSAGSTTVDPVNGSPSGFTILGPIFLSPEQMNRFVKNINPKAPELGSYYLTFGDYYGIRGDVAFAQALLETDYFRFTGDVTLEQNNFSGLGATGSKARGASFKTAEEGVLAHLQHLYAYATTKNLPSRYPLVDPRFHLVERGSAPTWIALNGKWAVPGRNYGQTILDIYERMLHTSIQHLETTRQNLNP